jgi:hypothetical protein
MNLEGGDDEDDDEYEEDYTPEPSKASSSGGAYLPSGAVPTVNGKLSQHAAEFWFPESRECKCCHGFKYGCSCAKSGFIACQEEGCVEEVNKGKRAGAQSLQKAEGSPRGAGGGGFHHQPAHHSPTNVCKFEMSPGGCRFGATCRYKHQYPPSNLASSSADSPKGDKRIPCTYFAKGMCEFGDKCRFAHIY